MVSAGTGLGRGQYPTPTGTVSGRSFHLFVGLPVALLPWDFLRDPLHCADERWWGYLLPYYRPTWGPWPGVAHEAGVMLKVSFGLKEADRRWYVFKLSQHPRSVQDGGRVIE